MTFDTAAQRIIALDQSRYDAMIAGDTATLSRLLGDKLEYTHSTGLVDSKSSLLARMESGDLNYQAIHHEEDHVHVYEGVAIVTGWIQIDLFVGGTKSLVEGRFTDVWIEGPNGWQLAALQVTSKRK